VISLRDVLAGSPAAELGLRGGDQLLAIDGEPLEDFLDWNFLSAEPAFRLDVLRQGVIPVRETVSVKRDLDEEFGVVLEPPAIKRCTNKCDFCFIDQMPAGLRRSLYVKDEDYRYSFLYGNFVTTTNLKESDYRRILRYRLTPLYVSVHATDPDVRERILKNPKARELLPNLGRLAEGGIAFHTQVVLCPGVNDGAVLLRTFDDLLPFGEALLSISVVPVGLTGHRERLPGVATVSATEARALVAGVESYRARCADPAAAAKIFLSDEFYLQAGTELPDSRDYGDFGLVENGVGMTRLFLEEFASALPDLVPGDGRRVALLTGRMMAPLFERTVKTELAARGWRPSVVAVENRLFGSSVTCAGLLAGRDLLEAARASVADVVLYPQDCLNIDGRFLDDLSQEELAAALRTPTLASRHVVEELNEAAALGRAPSRARSRTNRRPASAALALAG
jgi:putative radical SAM enzyme (TIGR03279 family)